MITSISKLKSFGVFQDFKPSQDLKPFVQYNVFYGWNASGKSTLAKVFLSITDKKTHTDFPDAEFTIHVNDCPDITHKNISQNLCNVKVFSKDFVERNVNFEESKANSILILSEEKKEEMENYKTLQAKIGQKDSAYQIESFSYSKATEELKKNLSKWASNIKKSFELIETSNTYYLNYDRTKLNAFIKTNRERISHSSILSVDEVKTLKNAIKPNRKPNIDIQNFKTIQIEGVKLLVATIQKLLLTSIFSQQIKRLTDNPEINQWVRIGLDLSVKYNSNNCEFCGQNLPTERIAELNKHFSKQYDELIRNLNAKRDEIINLKTSINTPLPDTAEFYDELHIKLDSERFEFEKKRFSCLEALEDILQKIGEKNKNPFEIISYQFSAIEQIISDYNESTSGIEDLVKKHNLKNEGFEEAVKLAQSKLELHFASEILLVEKYIDIENELKLKKAKLDIEGQELQQLRIEVRRLEGLLINAAIAADEFNKNLEKFLGRSDISLDFDTDLKGYKLMRRGKAQPARNLSEGEKTAIAFTYFISKLKESGNLISSSTIVLDDPISSFDSNHLFHSYSYLKKECEQAKQLFIFTHNFQYFKLIRDWLIKKNERKKRGDGTFEERMRTNFYTIDCTFDINRESRISNANNTLLNYSSEYHYIFQKLAVLKDTQSLDLEKAFLIANLSRKLLEAFLTFKFPKGRNDFNQLLQAGCPDVEMREKVYRFINKYSHNQVIDFNDGPIDNLLSEGNNIVLYVVKIIEDLDPHHYNEMLESCVS